MARYLYGATSADFTMTAGGRVIPGAVLTIWSARTGGTQITDLQDLAGVAISQVVSGADGSVAYMGPDNDKTTHWAQASQGNRIAIRPVDITGATGPTGATGATGPTGPAIGALLTTKGDLAGRDGSAAVRVPVGPDGMVLVADSPSGPGVMWDNPGRVPRITGSPEGVVTASPGATVLQTDATTDVKGWIRWIKATGTGNAGWKVGPEADTDWREILTFDAAGTITRGSFASAYWQPLPGSAGFVRVRRTAHQVHYWIHNVQSTLTNNGFCTVVTALPAGFRYSGKAGTSQGAPCVAFVGSGASRQAIPAMVSSENNGYDLGISVYAATPFLVNQEVSMPTTEAWPTSLPGTAA